MTSTTRIMTEADTCSEPVTPKVVCDAPLYARLQPDDQLPLKERAAHSMRGPGLSDRRERIERVNQRGKVRAVQPQWTIPAKSPENQAFNASAA